MNRLRVRFVMFARAEHVPVAGFRHSRRGRLLSFTGSCAEMEAYGLPLLMIHSHVCTKALTT